MEQRQYIQQDANWEVIANQAYQARNMRLMYEKAEIRAFDQLKQLSNNIPSRGGEFIFDFSDRKGSIDYSSIPELQGLDLEKYRKSAIITWKLEKIINIEVIV